MLADAIEVIVKGEKRFPFFGLRPEIEKYAKEFASRIINEKLLDVQPHVKDKWEEDKVQADYQTLDINSLEHTGAREIGAEWLCQQAIRQLGLNTLLTATCGLSEDLANIALMHIVSRSVFPASEHKTAQWIKEHSAVSGLFDVPINKVDRFKLYAASNNLYAHKTAIEKGLSNKTNELFDLHDKIMFYDLINTYFEDRRAKSEMAKFGKSKEKRSDAKIIALAAVINAEGFLKHSRIHQGNISDSKTLNFKTPLICSGGLFTFWVNTSLYEKVAGNDVVKFNR